MDSNDAIAPQADMFAAMGEMKKELQRLEDREQLLIDLLTRVKALEQAIIRSPP